MTLLERYSEPYGATGALAGVGILNQLGRPNVEALELLVREAIQNCWDARVKDRIMVEVGRETLDREEIAACRRMLSSPPPKLPLKESLVEGMQVLWFADFGTHGLRGPVRADQAGLHRDYVDFVLNVGQPPDKELGGGSFGYGKAAFYRASRARTIIIDTLCHLDDGSLERRLIGCALGQNFQDPRRRLFTGRHWWGVSTPYGPMPVTGADAAAAASILGLPERSGPKGVGTTIAILDPDVELAADGRDHTMSYVAEAISWNFWPRMIDTPGGLQRSMEFRLVDERRRVPIPDLREHPRLRGFVEAMDWMRMPAGPDDDFILDRPIESKRPARRLGRLVIAKGPVTPMGPTAGPRTQGARATADAVHHVALMRAPEIVVKYLPGDPPATGRFGYSGVFCSDLGLDEAFKAAEPPAHDDWVARSVADKDQRAVVSGALRQIRDVCRDVAGYSSRQAVEAVADEVPLGYFADALAALMPTATGIGARRLQPISRSAPSFARSRRDLPSSAAGTGVGVQGPDAPMSAGVWQPAEHTPSPTRSAADWLAPEPDARPQSHGAPPQVREAGEATPAMEDGDAVLRYPFELRTNGNRVRLNARVEVMTTDGRQVEDEPPVGEAEPQVYGWRDPSGQLHRRRDIETGPGRGDGFWTVMVGLSTEAMMRVDLEVASL